MAREPRHTRMYKKTPKLERGEDGHVGVKEKEADEVQSGDEGVAMTEHHDEHGHDHARRAMHHRHMHEHMMLHHHHEIEHSHHEGDKVALHEKHEKEYSEMHHRHHHEMKKMHESNEKEVTGGEHKDMDIKEGKETGKDKGE